MNKLPVILLCGNAGVGKDTVGDIIKERFGFTKFAQADTIKDIAKDVFGFTDEQLWGPSANRNAVDTRFARGSDSYDAIKYISKYPYGPFLDKLYKSFIQRAEIAKPEMERLAHLLRTFCAGIQTFIETEGGLTPRIVLQLLGTEVGRAYDADIWVRRAVSKARQYLVDPQGECEGVVVSDGRFRNEIVGFRNFGGYALKINGNTSLPPTAHASEVEVAKIPPRYYDGLLFNNKEHGMAALRYAVHELLEPWFTPSHISTYA